MALWPFGRKKDEMAVDTLLEQANAAGPTRSLGTFRLTVQDVFSITGRGTVVTGRVEAGTVRVGQAVDIVRAGAVVGSTEVTGVEMFRKILESATVGDDVGLLLAGVSRQQVDPGDELRG